MSIIGRARAVWIQFRLGDYHLRCRIFGHAYDPIGAEFYSVYRCERCGQSDGYQCGPREWIRVKIWLFKDWLRGERRGWSEWWKCTECGGRFGRHDDRFDHIPF